MKLEEAKNNINKTVYGILVQGTEVIIEELILESVDSTKKSTSIVLKPSKGTSFRSGLSDYYLTKKDAVKASYAVLQALLDATNKELAILTKEATKISKEIQKVNRDLAKEETLERIRK